MTNRKQKNPKRAPEAFAHIKHMARPCLPALLQRWLPDGHVKGSEWFARNPRRADRHLGSFKININTGQWADFATGDKGGDVISLAAYLFSLSQSEAARRIARMLCIETEGRHHG